MTTTKAGLVLKHIRELVASDDADRLSDQDLLRRFTSEQQPAAFEALLQRYGGLVLGVCRRVLANRQDAEDAFQATFLVLARAAGSIRNQESLGSWLYGVAYRVAAKARLRSARRLRHEANAPVRDTADALAEVTGRELVGVLDEELGRLGERLRAPLVLCYLEGKTRDEAARELGWSLSTLQRRLEEGRERLRGRLARRGLTLPAVLLATGVVNGANAAVPGRLTRLALRGALEAASGAATPASVSAAAASLASGVARAAPARLTVAAVLLIGLAGLALGLASGTASARPGDPGERPTAKRAPAGEMTKPKDKQPGGTAGIAGKENARDLSVSGRVFDVAGKVGREADVILVGHRQPKGRAEWLRCEVLARGRTDRDGHYRVTAKGIKPEGFEALYVLAGAKGCGLGCCPLARAGGPQVANLYLRPERPVTVTLIDLQGQPAAGVKVRLHSLADDPKDPRMVMLGRKGAQLMDARTLAGYVVRHERMWGFEFVPGRALKDFAFWPAGSATTDSQGRFVLRGFGEGHVIRLVAEDDRFAAQELRVNVEAATAAKGITLPLAPARWLEGRVLAEDTGKPLAGANLLAQTTLNRELSLEDLVDLQIRQFTKPAPLDRTATRTDAEGRFRLRLAPGDTVSLLVFAPEGSPYLGIQKSVKLTPGTARHALPLALPRGVEIRGRVTEQASGAAVAGAGLYFLQQRDNNPRARFDLLIGEAYPSHSGPDGSYRIVVPTQPGHLLVTRAGQGFIELPITRGELYTGKPSANRRFDGMPGAEPVYFHAIHRLDVAPQAGVKELPVSVRRGVTLRGRLIKPDGRPVPRAFLFCGGALLAAQDNAVRASYLHGDLGRAIPVYGGDFELRGCDPDKTYSVYFLSEPRETVRSGDQGFANQPQSEVTPRLGAAVKLSAASAGGKPLTVRLYACGAVEFRCLDQRGRPLRRVPETPGSWKSQFETADGQRLDQRPYLDLLVEPRRGTLGEERLFLGFPFNHGGYRSPFGTDKEGRVRLTGLIPGAEYRLKLEDEAASDSEGYPPEWGRSFSVEAGMTRRLPDLVLPLALGRKP
jgi:RNA polymerase sigma factor (sigma-70 family)